MGNTDRCHVMVMTVSSQALCAPLQIKCYQRFVLELLSAHEHTACLLVSNKFQSAPYFLRTFPHQSTKGNTFGEIYQGSKFYPFNDQPPPLVKHYNAFIDW